MASDNNFTRILDSRTDQDSPYTEELAQDHVSNENHAFALVRSDGSALCTGTIDSVTNVANSVVTDSVPSAGAITNILVGHVIEMVDGDAQGVMATVTVAGSGSTFTVNTNLVSAGVQAGDEYRILYGIATDMAHTHDGIDAPKIDPNDIDALGLREYTEAGNSQSVTRSSSSGSGSASHTLVLPTSGEDYFIFGQFKTSGNITSDSSSDQSGDADITINSVIYAQCRFNVRSEDGATQHTDRVNDSGGIVVVAQDGQTVVANVNLDQADGEVAASFEITGYQKVP